MNQESVYLPLLKEFCEQHGADLLNSGYPYAPFIPVAFKEYSISSPRIFYVGIDTYYWGVSPQELLKAFNENSLSDIIHKNNTIVTPERILTEWHSNKGLFWAFVCKLHLYIRTGVVYDNNGLRNLSPADQRLLFQLGWGNMNSIELKRTLGPGKEEIWDEINHKLYWNVKEASEKSIDPIKNLISSYSPEYIIILGWGDNENHVFNGLSYNSYPQFYEDSFRALYTLEDDVKVIWTSHPSRFSFLGTNQEEMVQYVGDSLKLF